MKIIIEPLVFRKLSDLINILLEENYFATSDKAFQYAQGIYDFIDTIPGKAVRSANNYTSGQYVCMYQPNRRTTWYIFFDTDDTTYLIRNIITNYSPEYSDFIAGLK